MKIRCKICRKEFETKRKNQKICSSECRKIDINNYVKNYLIKKSHDRSKQYELNGVEGKDYIICKICGMMVKRIYGMHLKIHHNNLPISEYKKMFPGSPISCLSDKHNISKNSGKFMKEEKYRRMFSEKMKGENNPMHKSKKSEQERKENSPFSKEFYKKRGLSEEDRKEFMTRALKDREFDTKIEYWLNRGFTLDESEKKLKERQSTFSLEKCILKYGENEGEKRWIERQEKWKAKVFNKENYIRRGESKLSKHIIENILKDKEDRNFLFGKNEKFIYDKKLKRAYKYDFTDELNKKIIEINGVFWHCKPSLFEENYFHKIKKMTAKEIWDYNNRKIEIAENFGYKVLIIWEDDFYKNPEFVIKECLNFIYEKAT